MNAIEKPTIPAISATKIMNPLATKKSDSAITKSVGAGRSAPKLVNTDLNCGMTKTIITAVTPDATTRTAIG